MAGESEGFHITVEPPPAQPRAEFNFDDGSGFLLAAHATLREQVGDLRKKVGEHEKSIATHEGALRGFQSAISAVQSSLAAKIATISVIAALLAGLGWFNLTRTSGVGDRVDALSSSVNGRLGGLEVRSGAIEANLSVLPQQVVHELRQQEADMAPPKRP